LIFSGITVSVPSVSFSFQPGAIAPPYNAVPASALQQQLAPNATASFRYTRRNNAGRSRRESFPRWSGDGRQPSFAFSPVLRHASPAPPVLPVTTQRATGAEPEAYANAWQRAAALFIDTYSGIFSCTTTQARALLQEADDALYNGWRNSSTIGQAWTPSGPDEPRSAHDLAYAATVFSQYLHRNPDLDDTTARNVARTYLVHPPVTPLESDVLIAIYQDVLRRRLDWIDMDKLCARDLNAEEILKAVCRHRKGSVLTGADLDRRLLHYRDVVIDEAALIAHQAARHGSAMDAHAPIAAVRAQFVTALIDEWQDCGLGVALMPSAAIPPAYAVFWYDGMVLRNARGKNLAQIVDALYEAGESAGESAAETAPMQRLIDHASRPRWLLGQPGDAISASRRENLLRDMHGDMAAVQRYAVRPGAISVAGVWLTRSELHGVIGKALRNLALDTVYPSGTALNAIATILHRQGPLHDIYVDRFDNTTELITAFNRLNHAWQQHPRFPVQPRLCAAHYLAESSGVLLLDARSAAPAEQQVLRRVYGQLSGQLTGAAQQNGLPPPAGIVELIRALDEIMLLSPQERMMALEALDQTGSLEIYLGTLQEVDTKAAAPEKISYRDTADLHRQLTDYFNQRLLAHAPLQTYDEDILILQILRRKLGMTAEDLQDRGVTTTGRLPLDEFKACADNAHASLRMTHRGKTIDPAAERRALRNSAARTLFAHPILAAKSKEILRREGKACSAADAQEVQRLLVDNIMGVQQPLLSADLRFLLESLFGSATLATIVRALASGSPREILGLLPFVIPLYDIGRGIQLGDEKLVWDGALQFGVDALLTLLGAGAEAVLRKQLAQGVEAMLFAQSRMSVVERTGTETIRRMQVLMPEGAPEQLAQRRITVDEDAFDVHAVAEAPAATIPKSLEALSTIVCAPDNRPYRMLFLDAEQVQVPAIASGLDDVFIETDLRGNPLPQAAPILLDPDSARYVRLTPEYGALRKAGGIAREDMLVRRTVFDVLVYWRSVRRSAGARFDNIPYEDIIRAVFKSSDHPLWNEFLRFWITACERSETALAIIRRAFQKVLDGKEACRVEFNANSPHARHDSIWFIGDEALSRLRYVSPVGAEPFQRSRMWVHEAIHWLTDMVDPAQHEAVDNCGGPVFLTNRILGELGDDPPIPPRTIYMGAPPLGANPESKSLPRDWSRALRHFHDTSVAENIFLDNKLDEGRKFPSTMHLFGQSIAERLTVRQVLALDGYISTFGKLASGNGARIFDLIADAFAAPLRLHFRSKLRTLTMGSDIFRKLAVVWNTRLRMAIIDIAVEDFDSHHRLYDDRIRHASFVAQDGEQIMLNKQVLYYFSQHGVEPVSPLRQLTGAMVDLFLRDMIPGAYYLPIRNPFFDRGAGVMLENLILRQIGDMSPKRICKALTADRRAYLANQSTIMRATVSEDGYLSRKLQEGQQAGSTADRQDGSNAVPTGRCLSSLCRGISALPKQGPNPPASR
jgi:hypothetical protein